MINRSKKVMSKQIREIRTLKIDDRVVLMVDEIFRLIACKNYKKNKHNKIHENLRGICSSLTEMINRSQKSLAALYRAIRPLRFNDRDIIKKFCKKYKYKLTTRIKYNKVVL